MVKAHQIWAMTFSHLENLLDEQIIHQWFKPLLPLVIADNCLIILAPNAFSASWLNEHYKELIDALILIHDKNLSSFIVDKKIMSSKSPTSKIDRYSKNNNGRN